MKGLGKQRVENCYRICNQLMLHTKGAEEKLNSFTVEQSSCVVILEASCEYMYMHGRESLEGQRGLTTDPILSSRHDKDEYLWF